jgi:hypothetical protein
VFWFISLDNCCHSQLLADAAAGGRGEETKKISEKEAFDVYVSIPKISGDGS